MSTNNKWRWLLKRAQQHLSLMNHFELFREIDAALAEPVSGGAVATSDALAIAKETLTEIGDFSCDEAGGDALAMKNLALSTIEKMAALTRTTQENYEQFLADSGLEGDPFLQYTYFHGAGDFSLQAPWDKPSIEIELMQAITDKDDKK